ncbi:TolC family protein [Roseiconus lacunae]|uniref:TolC family protein n=1 Tax=Roseiconus lacunae TaxID=2605694 RepID=A0ABT7PF31_9BACT|nr:TolC family protein [Roseiconus lacunae]MDM4015099.1 TolC family protein [Roseiconus lacunae]
MAESLVDANASPEVRDVPEVQAVVFRDDEPGEGTEDSVDSEIQLAVPVKVEGFAMGEPGITLDAIEQLALANNPAIQQANAASARAGGIRTQVGLKPNPTIGYFGEEIGNEGAGGLHGAFVSQTFVRGDKLAWNRQVIGHDVNAMNWQIETQRQRVRTDIRLAFYDALAAQKRLQLAKDFRSVAQEGVTVSEERVDAKVGTRPDVLQSEIQLNEVDLSIQRAKFELSAALNELAALAGVPDLGTPTLIGELDAAVKSRDAEAEFAQIVAMSPQLAAAQARVDRARANIQRQQVQPIPNVTAQLGAGGDDGTGNAFANVQLSLPVPVHNKNQGNIRAAQAEYCAATQNVQRIRQGIRRDLSQVMREYNIAEATVRQYEQSILPKADETLKLMQQARDAGEFDFLRVLTARRAYFDANLKYVTAMGQLAQANAKIDGLLLTGGLSNVVTYDVGDDLRGQALSGQ